MTDKITGRLLLKSIQEGGNRIISKRKKLNEINVFPVADSDTGSNLSSLMIRINEISEQSISSVQEALDTIGEKALEGARGNSGMIFAQYLNGVSRSYELLEDSNLNLSQALLLAVDDAYEAVQDPQEGTILTVMKVWAQSLHDCLKVDSLADSLNQAREASHLALLKTDKQHQMMKKHGVVDAGAMGFYEFVDGLTDYFTGVIKEEVVEEVATSFIHEQETIHLESSHYRYCMEITLGNHIDHKENLESYGDSIVVAQGKKMTRIHIHTNDPILVTQEIEKESSILRFKIDDMRQQFFDAHKNKDKIALVTDSIADLPKEVVEKFNVHVVPLTILVEKTEYLDKLTLSNERLLSFVDQGNLDISTSLANTNVILKLLTQLEANYESAIFISVSSLMSGTFQAFTKAKEQYQGNLKIELIDSKLNSIAQGLLVKTAGQYIQEGYELNEISQFLKEDRENISIYVAVSDLDPMIQSGRVPQVLGRLFKKARLRPIVTIDLNGDGKLFGIGLSAKQNKNKIKKIFLKKKQQVEDLWIGYTDEMSDSNHWLEYFSQQNIHGVMTTQTSSIVALSAGKNATAVAIKYKKGESK